MAQDRLRDLLHRDRLVMSAALGLIVLICSFYILTGAGTGMSLLQMTAATGPRGALLAGTPDMVWVEVWTLDYGIVILDMWFLMMVAMMLPSAAPAVLLYGALNPARGLAGMLAFLAGYLAIWAGMSLLATLAQAGLAAFGLISAMYMSLAAPWLAVAVLIGAGLYQLTPAKAACLTQCRGPVEMLTRFRKLGPFRIGLKHGILCLGCCWALMALLFVGGVMNLWWILGLTAYVALEKLAPAGPALARVMAFVLLAAGLVLAAAHLAGRL